MPGSLPGAELPWRDWAREYIPDLCSKPFGERHERLWNWIESLGPGSRPRPRVEIWPRAGAKSSTIEGGVCRLAFTLRRRFALFVSRTQDQADLHVGAVGTLLEKSGVERKVGKYGQSKGWRRDQLQTANGFYVAAYGMDTALRGVRLDEYRPDLAIFDDLDKESDSPEDTEKVINGITTSIMPAGSTDCAHLFVQNKVLEEGLFGQLVSGKADFLYDREVYEEPAIIGLETERIQQDNGTLRYEITGGEATWDGQDLETCEFLINEWGLSAFLREAQHEVRGAGGFIFDPDQLFIAQQGDLPPIRNACLAWDLAATEGGGDYTVAALIALFDNGRYGILSMIRGQWSPERVMLAMDLIGRHYSRQIPGLRIRLPLDPGAGGKFMAMMMSGKLPGQDTDIQQITGSKAVRAKGFAEQVNLGNVLLLNLPLPAFLLDANKCGGKPLVESIAPEKWHAEVREELGKFRDGKRKQKDDIVDALSDAHRDLVAGMGRFWEL